MRSLLLVLLLTAAVWAQDEGTMGVEFGPGARVLKGSGELLEGDFVISLNGETLQGKTFPQALAMLRRPPGPARLGVVRGSRLVSLEFTWKPFSPEWLAAREAEVRERKTAVTGLVEHWRGPLVTVMLDQPVARAFSPGALVALMPDETVVGEGRVTKVVSLYRLEVELKPGSVAEPWERVIVTP